VDVAAFIKATSIIGGRDTVEDFLACSIWPLSESCYFVETKETPLSKVMVLVLKVSPAIGTKESKAAFKMQIVNAANLLVDNYDATEHNAYTGL
jgi:hypothetical protein